MENPGSSQAMGSPALQPYVDPLPVPQVIRTTAGQKITIRMQEFYHKVHRDLSPGRIWGYNGMWPGPTFKVNSGAPLTVKWVNDLPTSHFLPIDTTIHGAESNLPEVRTVVHLHGARVMPESDGYPEAWFTSDGKRGPSYVAAPYHYPNCQPAATLWYHDHAIGITRLNIYAGMAGFYLIRDRQEEYLNLPSGDYDIPMMIQDRKFNPDGSLLYPVERNGTHPVWVQEFFGDVTCVNGKATPFLEVEPRKYRFRLLNASNSRFYFLTLIRADRDGNISGKPADAPAFYQIGTDGGLRESPLPLQSLNVSPGERFDVVIDFSEHGGKNFAIVNDPPPSSSRRRERHVRGSEIVPREVLLFKVTKRFSGKDTSVLPATLVPVATLNPAGAARERFLSLTELERPWDEYPIIGLLGGKHWNDPVTENPKADSTEIWSFVNTTTDVHSMHIHLVRFQVLNRQPFNWVAYLQSRNVVYTDVPRLPEADELGAWKDTVKTYPGMVTRVIAKFELPVGAQLRPGTKLRYVWHCHMLEHEDNEMMRPFDVIS